VNVSSSTSWDDAVEVDHPEFLASLSSPKTGSSAASAAVVQAEPHATTEGSTDPSVVAGGRRFLSPELSDHVDQLVGLYP